jgi:hypothetical protein
MFSEPAWLLFAPSAMFWLRLGLYRAARSSWAGEPKGG